MKWGCKQEVSLIIMVFIFHIVEQWKIYSHQKIFRQIKSVVVTFLVKTLISRNFRDKKWCQQISVISTLWSRTFLCNKSSANCNPTAFMSVFCNADVIYMCMSKNRSIAPPCSACSISNWDSKLTNHSKDRWSRLIQKKST